MNIERINSKGYRLPCNADFYKKDIPFHESLNFKKAKSDRERDEFKAKVFSEAFDPKPYLKYLSKGDKENTDNSILESQNINTNVYSKKLPKII